MMKKFKMADVEKIEAMMAAGKTVEIEWKEPYEKDHHIGFVKSVRWDGLVFTTDGAVFTGISKLVEIREVA